MAKATTRTMTAQHKAALAEGRSEGRAVKNYLEALQQNRPRRGRKRTPDSIKKRLAAIDAQFDDVSALQQLQLVQERMDLSRELETMNTKVDLSALEAAFVKTASQYARRKGISYAAWRELGVSADVLKRAGISRASAT
jgi:signal transduction histidine kinase